MDEAAEKVLGKDEEMGEMERPERERVREVDLGNLLSVATTYTRSTRISSKGPEENMFSKFSGTTGPSTVLTWRTLNL